MLRPLFLLEYLFNLKIAGSKSANRDFHFWWCPDYSGRKRPSNDGLLQE